MQPETSEPQAIDAWFEALGEQIAIDWTDRPWQIFRTGKKTARHGVVARRLPGGNRPLVAEKME